MPKFNLTSLRNTRYSNINRQTWRLWTRVIQIALASIIRGITFFNVCETVGHHLNSQFQYHQMVANMWRLDNWGAKKRSHSGKRVGLGLHTEQVITYSDSAFHTRLANDISITILTMEGICQKYTKSTIRMKKLSLSSNCITINIEIWMQHVMHNIFAFYAQN